MLKSFPRLRSSLFVMLMSVFVVAHVGSVGGERGQPVTGDLRFAQQSAITREFMFGEWSTRNIEFGQDVEILWTLWPDSRLAYRFIIDGMVVEGSRGTWEIEAPTVIERWVRPNGETGVGRGTIEKIDDNTLRLTIGENGDPNYRGVVRVYRRRGAPQISMFSATP